jgi:hypothetical protein
MEQGQNGNKKWRGEVHFSVDWSTVPSDHRKVNQWRNQMPRQTFQVYGLRFDDANPEDVDAMDWLCDVDNQTMITVLNIHPAARDRVLYEFEQGKQRVTLYGNRQRFFGQFGLLVLMKPPTD